MKTDGRRFDVCLFARLRRHVVLILLAVLCAGPARAADADKILVFAAVSLSEALTDVAELYVRTGQPKPVFSFAASSTLARQIENGAPAGIFVSADEQWMDYLTDRGLVAAGTRTPLLGNTLVLVSPTTRPLKLEIGSGFPLGFPLAKALGTGKLALADPTSVPAGRYAKAALENLGVWREVEGKVVRAESVRAALVFVERGEVAAGIVYATDAAVAKNATVVGIFPPTSHPEISYPIAAIAGHDTPAARAFRDFMLGDSAKAIYRKYGFVVK